MKIISLSSSIAGPACSIACSIKKNFYNGSNSYPTNMFDYLEISLLSIIQILESENSKDKINSNYEIYLNKDNKYSVKFNNYDHIISHHDLPNFYSEEQLSDVIEKYKRRYDRLINYIKSEDKIFFIRYGLEDYNMIEYFFNIIKKINPNLELFFINIFYKLDNSITEIFNKNYTLLNFNNYIDKTRNYSDDLFYKIIEFDWSIINKIISLNLTEYEIKNLYTFSKD